MKNVTRTALVVCLLGFIFSLASGLISEKSVFGYGYGYKKEKVDKKGSKNERARYKKLKGKFKNEGAKTIYSNLKTLKKSLSLADKNLLLEMRGIYEAYKSHSSEEIAMLNEDTQRKYHAYKNYRGYKNYRSLRDKLSK